MEDVRDIVIGLIAEALRLDDEEKQILRDEATDRRLIKWDSVGHVQIIVELEEQFDIEIDERTIPRLNNLRKIVDYVEKQRA